MLKGIPSWEKCAEKHEQGLPLAPLEEFIYLYAPRDERSARWWGEFMRALDDYARNCHGV